jgi:hypothetical protein
MENPPEPGQRRSRWEPPVDSDLIGIPLVLGVALAIGVIVGAFWINGLLGVIVLGIFLIAALAISYRVVMSSEIKD